MTQTPPFDLSDYTPNADLSRAATMPARCYTDSQFLELEKDVFSG